MNTVFITVLVFYLALMIGISFWFSRGKSMKDGDDFVLAGKSLPAPVLAGTLLATFVGSGSIIGGANFIYTYGPFSGVFFFGGMFSAIVCLYFVAPKVRDAGYHTLPEMFNERFNGAVRVVGIVVVLVAFLGITAYQFTGAGYILSLIAPVSELQGAIISFILITFLALSGGLKSVAWTDFLSSIFIVIGLGLVAGWVFIEDVGGLGSWIDQLNPEFKSLTGTLSGWQALGYFLPLFLLILGDQNMHQRLAAAKSGSAAKAGMGLFFIGAFFVVTPVILAASSSRILQPDIDADKAILSLAASEYSPNMLGAVLLVAALALILTTGSSYLLTCSGNIVYDLIFHDKPQEHSGKTAVNLGRAAVLGLSVIAFVLVQFFPSVLALQMYAYSMYGASITPVVLAALYWRKATSQGALAAMLVGGIVTIGWELIGKPGDLNSIIPALPCAVLALVSISIMTQRNASSP
ncbi:sodium:solute symporter [Corynebacterium sp. HMSC05E07]|uniref:sodium:solute symporter family protein n=1 Tax=Corynebacterium sp. HMSC05E07 TaxID=1581117 RepID=UPI0008A4E217|nr:sodium:solute symporter family protein [Corynebacterium sp. HMSC05E07]OFT57464.1 sodium:proline symporter [Corynebacterium sp. HMSC05E07]